MGDTTLDASWVNQRMDYYALYDIDLAGDEKKLRLVGGMIKEVSDGTWLIPGGQTKCYKVNEAADVLWDAVPEAGYPPCWSIDEFLPKLCNQECDKVWRRVVTIDYEIN